MSAHVEIYTWHYCPYCIRALDLLRRKGVDFEHHAIDGDEEAREAMSRRAGGRRSVPQIFIDGRHVGGCDDLHALDRTGALDPLLGLGPRPPQAGSAGAQSNSFQ